MGVSNFRLLYRKYAAAVFFPLISFSLIYADYSRTQRWKASLAAKENHTQ